jgi:hypothetical protein
MKRSEQKHTTVGSGWKMKNRYILAFFHGMLISTLFYSYAESHYETVLFKNIIASIKSEPVNARHEDSFLLCAMHVCHQLLGNRKLLFDGYSFSGFKTDIMYPVTNDLMTGNGACGSFSRVLARILQANDVEVRLAEMKVSGRYGGHITIEANTSHGWVALDPSYDLYFTTPQGTLASFANVQQNWAYYKMQAPPGYNYAYNYAGVRYTNWNKIPVLLPATKKVLQWTWGKEKTEQLSLRTYFLQPYHIVFCCSAFVYLLMSLYTLRRWFLFIQ